MTPDKKSPVRLSFKFEHRKEGNVRAGLHYGDYRSKLAHFKE
jgi:hypothetical protein